MKNVKSIAFAGILVVTFSVTAFAKSGTISATKTGTISATKTGTISATKTGTISATKTGYYCGNYHIGTISTQGTFQFALVELLLTLF